MGLKNYFKAPPASDPSHAQEMTAEKSPSRAPAVGGSLEMPRLRTPSGLSSRDSFAPSSSRSSTFIDDIKHEVMVNYLYQQQCSQMWFGDMAVEQEGVVLRKNRNNCRGSAPELSRRR